MPLVLKITLKEYPSDGSGLVKHLQYLAGAILLLSPLYSWAQSTPTASPSPISQPVVLTEVPTATIAPEPMQVLTEQVKDAQAEIKQLTDDKADTDLEFRRLQRVYIEELMRDRAAAAKKARNLKKSAEILKEIDDWDALRLKEWDQDRDLLDKKARLRQLQREQARFVDEKLEERLKENGMTRGLSGVEEGKQMLTEIEDLDNQQVALEKQLFTLRENYDYKGANEIRTKLKDIQVKFGEVMKKATDRIKQIQTENPKDQDQQSL
jgi:hypothetical protein